MFKIEKGRHKSWREFGFRIHKTIFIDYDELFIEFNFWKYFITVIIDKKGES